MRLTVNGEPFEIADHATVTDLLARLDLPATRAAVEVNRTLVRRADHAGAVLRDGDAVEVVTLVGGG